MKIINGGVAKPKGFKANGLNCGIKSSGKLDLGLIASDGLAVSISVFTKNSVKAAPLTVSQKHAQNNKVQAIIINSGNANCFTGHFGLIYADRTTAIIGKLLNIPKENQNAVSVRIKIMSRLDITTNQIPQDVRFKLKVASKEVDFRFSILPTTFGLKVVMLVLVKSKLDVVL